MSRRLLTAIVFVLCLAVYAPNGSAGVILSGSVDSPIRLEVFSGFECPACGHLFFNTIQQVLKNYKGKVSVVYYEFPLSMHQHARPAARYAAAAARLEDQEKLLRLYETLFADRDAWSKDGNLEASVSRALSPEDFQKVKSIMEIEADSIERSIDRDIKDGMDRGIPGTPTLFLNYSGRQERIVVPPNVRDIYTLLSWRLNGLLRQQR